MTIAPHRPAAAPTELRPPIGDVQARKAVPIKWWAGIGVACLGMIIYCWTDWVASGDAHPSPKGADKLPSWMPMADRLQEGAVIALLLVTIYFFGYKQWKQERRLSLDGLLILAMTSVYMLQDPWENYSAIGYSYNSGFVNLGCPQCHVPGWLSPGGSGSHQFVEPLLFIGLMYGGVLMLGMIATCAVMRRAKLRWPAIGTPGLIGVALAFGLVLDLALELPAQRGGGWVWWFSANDHLTLFYGKYYQLPIVECVLWGSCWSMMGALRFFRNDKGETIAERGLDRLKVTGKKQTFVRFLALSGALNLMMLVMYNIPYQFIGAHSGATVPAICNKTYFNDGMAGKGSNTHCPGPGIPLVNGTDSKRVDPNGNLYDPTKQGTR